PSLLLISKGDLVAMAFFFGYIFFNKNKTRRLFLVFLTGVTLAFLPSLLMYYSSLQKYRLTSSDRDSIYTTALIRMLEQPFGYGLGSQNNVIFEGSGINFPAHNFFLSIGLEFGWLYLSLIVMFLAFWLIKSKVHISNKLFFVSYLIIGFFGNAMYFYKYHTLALCLAMLGVLRTSINENMLYLKQKYCQRP
ncbi:O-antigen ligase family protein, partial [Buttiauxella ferragutiae]|uniref:O-antigen ligase family protein n=1 Tax=Buttiauxella ferragutiae TaxID=82989 RepID=UPI000AAD0C44